MPITHNGDSVTLFEEAEIAVMGWESHEPGIIKVFFNINWRITMNVIQCYTPTTTNNNEDDKDQLYERLQSIVVKYPDKNPSVSMRNLNAKV